MHGSCQLVGLGQGLECQVEPLHQGRDHNLGPEGGQVLKDDGHLSDPDFAVHAVQDDGLDALHEVRHLLVGQTLVSRGYIAPGDLGKTLPRMGY